MKMTFKKRFQCCIWKIITEHFECFTVEIHLKTELTLKDWNDNVYPPAILCLLSNKKKKKVVVFHIIQEWESNS